MDDVLRDNNAVKRDKYDKLCNKLSECLEKAKTEKSKAYDARKDYYSRVPEMSVAEEPANEFEFKRNFLNQELYKEFTHVDEKIYELELAVSTAEKQYEKYKKLAKEDAEND